MVDFITAIVNGKEMVTVGDSASQSLRTALQTNKGTSLFYPTLGANFKALLSASYTEDSINAVKAYLQQLGYSNIDISINRDSIEVTADRDGNT